MIGMNDLVLKSAVAGAASAVLADITLYLLNLLIPGPTINMPQLSAEFFLNIENYTLLHAAIGFVWSLIVGGVYAFIYLLVLENTGWRYLWLKSIVTISSIWLLGGGFVMRVMGLGQYVQNELLSVLAFYVAHLLFATYLYYFVYRLSGKPAS